MVIIHFLGQTHMSDGCAIAFLVQGYWIFAKRSSALKKNIVIDSFMAILDDDCWFQPPLKHTGHGHHLKLKGGSEANNGFLCVYPMVRHTQIHYSSEFMCIPIVLISLMI